MEVYDRIPVEQPDIDYAVGQDQWACAIARAIQRKYPHVTRVKVTTEKISYTDSGHRYHHTTPNDAVENIIRPLDSGHAEDIRPFVVLLDRPVVKQQHLRTPEQRIAERSKARNVRSKAKKRMSEEDRKRLATNSPKWGRICD